MYSDIKEEKRKIVKYEFGFNENLYQLLKEDGIGGWNHQGRKVSLRGLCSFIRNIKFEIDKNYIKYIINLNEDVKIDVRNYFNSSRKKNLVDKMKNNLGNKKKRIKKVNAF